MNNRVRTLGITVIFETSAFNRDENAAGNIQSLKKLKTHDGLLVFISANSLKSCMRDVLIKSGIWPDTEFKKYDQTVSFDIEKEDITTSPEMDLLGYLIITGGKKIARKGAIKVTKAVSLFNYDMDMSFYSNGFMMDRARKQGVDIDQSIFNREENITLFKYSILIDLESIGTDYWIVDKVQQNDLLNPDKIIMELVDERSDKKSRSSVVINKKSSPFITIHPLENKYKVIFRISEEEKWKRIKDFLSIIKNGFAVTIGGELNITTPLFLAVSANSNYVNVFHNHIHVKRDNDGQLKVHGVGRSIKNDFIFKQGESKLVYIEESERLIVYKDFNTPLVEDWNEFLELVRQNH